MDIRTCAVHCVDWPITAALVRDPALGGQAVIVRERVGARDLVRAATSEAKAFGVRNGMRRREAEAACVDAGASRSAGANTGARQLVVLDADLAHEARTFEAVARAVEGFTPRLEIDVPGRLSFATRGPSRYFGGDAALQQAVIAAVQTVIPSTPAIQAGVRAGIADGRFAARLAARTSTIVAAGESSMFVGKFPVVALGAPELASMLERLGLPTLRAFSELPTAAVLARFGTEGARLHELAQGRDPSPLNLSLVPPDCAASIELDPPVARVDAIAFTAKMLADQIVERLSARGLACTHVLVEAETEHGEQLARGWRHDDGFQPASLAERVRWQLDGWLQANAPVIAVGDIRAYQDFVAMGESGLDSTTGALTRLRLEPLEVVAIPARQLGLFGGDPAAALRADRALSRLQGMLGYEAVGTMVEQGGRTPDEQIALIPWGEPRAGQRPLRVGTEMVGWPGAIPAPYPARVFCPGVPARLLDVLGEPVRVSSRGEATTWPHRLLCDVLPQGGGLIGRCEGPWPSDVRWWDGAQHHRCVRWRVCLGAVGAVGAMVLVTVQAGRATVDALYD